MTRFVYLVLGWFCVGLGVIGIVLPLLPTTPFMIVAAFFFAKGSPRARQWLLNHKQFGPHIKAWEANGAITGWAKAFAVTAMGFSLGLAWLVGLPWWAIVIQLVCIIPASLFILSRPTAKF